MRKTSGNRNMTAATARFTPSTGVSPSPSTDHKKTQVGVVPADWRTCYLGTCLSSRPSYGINAAAVPPRDDAPVYLRITDIGDDGRLNSLPRASLQHPASENYLLRDGDLVFARTGASVGKSYLYTPSDGLLVFAGFLIRVRPNPTILLPEFLFHYVQSEQYRGWVATTSTRSGQPGINGREYAALPVPLPELSEQRAIAGALSDIDDLLQALEALIGKKRAVKQAAMQQLLTGRTRLPGFDRKWKAVRLGQLGSFSKGNGITREDTCDSGLPCIRYGELYTRYDNYTFSLHSFVDPAVARSALPIENADLLFAGSGETAEDIGRCIAYVGDECAYAGGDIAVLTPASKDSIDPIYFGHLMNDRAVATQRARMAQGNAVVHISTRALAQLRVKLPPVEEQRAVAKLLVDVDREIATIQQRLDKTRAIKQGMIQQLLTGWIRLVAPGKREATAAP